MAVWLAVVLAATGGICLVAGMLTAYLIADHSSSDDSPSSLIAIGLFELGVLAVAVGVLLLVGIALVRLWRRARRSARLRAGPLIGPPQARTTTVAAPDRAKYRRGHRPARDGRCGHA